MHNMWLQLLVILTTTMLGWLTWYVYRVYHRGQLLSAIPGPPRRPGLVNTLLGHLEDMGDNRHHFTSTQWAKQYGSMTLLRMFNSHIVQVADPVIASELLKDKNLDKSTYAYSILNAIFDDKGHSSLLTSQMTSQWRSVRRAVAASFSPQSLRVLFPKFIKVVDRLVENLTAHGAHTPVDMDLMCARLSWDVIGIVGFDTDMGATKVGEEGAATSGTIATVRAGMHEIEQRWGQPFRHSLWKYLLPSARDGERNLRRVHTILRGLLQKLRKVDPESLGNTIAGQLLRLKDPATGKPLSDDVIMPEIGTMFLAGFETSGHTEAWALYLISQHPEVEQRILEELAQHEVMAGSHGSARGIQYEDLGRLTYLNCVIKETLRFYPTVPSTDRVAPRDMHVGGYFIPKGTIFWISFYAMSHLASVYEDPEDFRPERWLNPNYVYATSSKAQTVSPTQPGPDASSADSSSDESWVDMGKQAPVADPKDLSNRPKRWYPFSDGSRSCVGQSLAYMNLVGTLAALLARFHFRLADQMGGVQGVRQSEEVAITLAPSKGLFMHAEPRQNQQL